MNKKQILLLSIILGVLALGILLKSWVRSATDNTGTPQTGLSAVLKFNPAETEEILIQRPAKTGGMPSPAVDLVKANGVWRVKSLWKARADPAKVENLIQKFLSVQGELRGSGKKLFSDFGIEDAEAFSIKFVGAGDKPLTELRLGTKQAGVNAYFIRTAANEDVYLAGLNLAELLGIYASLEEASPASLFWADLSLFNLDPEKVTEITVHRLKGEEKTMAAGLGRETDPKDPLKSSWKFLRQGLSSSPDPDTVMEWIAAMNSVRAEKVVDPAGKGYGLEKPVWQLEVTQGDKKSILIAGPKDEKGEVVYVKRAEDPAVFALKASFFDDLNGEDARLIKEVAPVAVLPEGQGKTS